MTIKDKFLDAVNTVKNTVVGATKVGAITFVAFNALGVAAHMTQYCSDAHLYDYSLKNRFKTAYCFDTTEEEKHYEYQMWKNDYREETRYNAHPLATYGVLAAGVALGACAGAAAARKENEARRQNIAQMTQKSR